MHNGCPDCGVTSLAESLRSTTESFVEKARRVHEDRYDYSQVSYEGAFAHVTIICPIHGRFSQAPTHHLSGQGCPDCAETGFNPNEPGILYYLAIATDDGDVRYKIGITNLTVEDRFLASDLARIRTVKAWRYAIGNAAAERESEILRQYAGDRYYGPPILSSGNTELFTHDILGLDNRDEECG